MASLIGIPYDTPKQPHIGSWDAVVPINVQGCERRHVNAEYPLMRNIRHQVGVEAVNAFRNNNMIGGQLAGFARQTFALLEIESRKLDRITFHQRDQVFGQAGCVERAQRLEVIGANFVLWCLFAVHKIVIHRQRKRLDAIGHQLHG